MDEKRWSSRVLMRYALIQLPGLAVLVLVLVLLQRWVQMPLWLLWTIVLLSVVKDVIMFPIVWRAYDKDSHDSSNSLTGELGTTTECLSPAGHIRIKGELWRAEIADTDIPVDKGETVRVLSSDGLTLIVKPEKDHEER
jgi:membrane protein implicated in regulation of membrane protease activity